MKIAVAQMSTKAGDFSATCERMALLSQRAAEQGAGLIVFPANVLTGPAGVSEPDREGFYVDLAGEMGELAGRLACPAIVPACADMGGAPVMEAMLIGPDGAMPLRLLAGLRSMAQAAGENEGASQQVPTGAMPEVEVGDLTLGVAFTYEELDQYVSYEYHVDAVLFISTYGFAADDPASALGCSIGESRFMADADAMGAWVIGVGSVGCYDLEVFCGSSFALAPWGELAAQAPAFEEALMVVDVDKGAEGPLAHPLAPQVFDPAVLAWQAAAEGTRSICESLGRLDACVLVDGSLSSMLAAAVATDALGPTHVHPLVLTGASAALDRASEKLVKNLRLTSSSLDRSELGEGVLDDSELAHDLAMARLRSLAREKGACVLSPIDKTSLALGSAPVSDLGCVMPFGDLYRSDVLALARLRNTVSPVVPLAARRTFAVDDLPGSPAPGVSDEARLEAVDYVISSYVEWERPLTDVAAECGDEVLAREVVARVRRSASLLPGRLLAPVLSSKTLDEARDPVGLAWRDRVRGADERLDLEGMAAAMAHEGGEEAAAGLSGADNVNEALDLLGLLTAGAGEAVGGQPAGQGGRHDPQDHPTNPFWGGPFSEN